MKRSEGRRNGEPFWECVEEQSPRHGKIER